MNLNACSLANFPHPVTNLEEIHELVDPKKLSTRYGGELDEKW